MWPQVFSELKNRGAEDALIAVCDGLKDLPEVINTTREQDGRAAAHHPLGSATRSAIPADSTTNAIIYSLKPVYTAVPKQAAEDPVQGVRRRVERVVPDDHPTLTQTLAEFAPFLEYDTREPSSNLHNQRNRADQHPLPAHFPSPRTPPQRAGSTQISPPGDEIA